MSEFYRGSFIYTIHYGSYSAQCAACVAHRCHTPAEWKNHPLAGHGYTPEQGWTHPSLGEAKNAPR